jgi:hypothetical protein
MREKDDFERHPGVFDPGAAGPAASRRALGRLGASRPWDRTTMNNRSKFVLTAVLAAVCLVPGVAQAKKPPSIFTGIVNHVSSDNIKVTDTKSGQTLGFVLLPKFDQIFSGDGKTTYQMKDVKAGQYVKVYYDQKMLGSRHADRIILLRQNNSVKRKE